jgi:hypothetical protein
MDKTTLKLLGLQRAEYEKAKTNERISWAFQIAVACAGLISIFVKGDVVTYTLALISLASTILKWRYALLSKNSKSVSDRARRLVFLMEGLGYKVSSKEITDLIASFFVSEKMGQQFEDPNYFETKLPAGYKKLCLILQESAFFSKHLFQISAEQSWVFVAVTFTLSIATLFSLPTISNPSWTLATARSIIVILIFLTSVDMFNRALSFDKAASLASKTDDRLEHIKESKHPEHDIIFVFSDYSAGVEGVPLISTALYDRNRERLNSLWSKRSQNWER